MLPSVTVQCVAAVEEIIHTVLICNSSFFMVSAGTAAVVRPGIGTKEHTAVLKDTFFIVSAGAGTAVRARRPFTGSTLGQLWSEQACDVFFAYSGKVPKWLPSASTGCDRHRCVAPSIWEK